MQRRAVVRFIAEEAKKQANMESITEKAIPDIKDDAPTQNVEEDWLTHFFDKCRLISDEEMQKLWAKVLAGEANSPGQFSKRTVSLLSSLDKHDAVLFQNLCSFASTMGNEAQPLVYDTEAPIYTERGINFKMLTHLDKIGLITFDGFITVRRGKFPKKMTFFYYGAPIHIEFPNPIDNYLDVGHVILSRTGDDLARICVSVPVPGFVDYIIAKWKSEGYKVEHQSAPQGPEPSQNIPGENT